MQCRRCHSHDTSTFEMAHLRGSQSGRISGTVYGFDGDVEWHSGNVRIQSHLAQVTAPPARIFISAASLSAQTKKASDWAGAYTFFDAPRNSSPAARGTDSYSLTSGIEYKLTITKKGDGFSATLEINGMQQFEVYECSTKVDESGDKLDFYFLGDGALDGGQRNIQKFKKGALLFSLMKIKTGAKTKHELQPVSFKLAGLSPKAKKQPIYFQKTN